MTISRAQVLNIARLARVKLDDDQVEHYRKDLSSILEYVDKLDELDVSDVEPTTHAAAVEPRLRDDEVDQRLDHDDVLKNAPQCEDGHFRVPKVVEG
jgi:aspartyl-tRNA(Asn)/glutamyl-tRNA(Gln) amidotransferase subunit C